MRSADGTTIDYRSVGSGPGLLLVPGAFALAADFDGLAAELADRFTVHTVERRGRGTSGPQGDTYSATAECADIEAVRAATGARFVFGHSFGGFLTLEAALAGSAFERIAVYEPGVSVDGSIPFDWAERCRRELDAGKPAEAFLTFVRGVNPGTSGKAPRWLLRLILPLALKKPERLQKHALLAAAIREHAEIAARDNTFREYGRLDRPVLLMAGKEARSTGAGRAAAAVHEVLPGSRLLLFPQLDHFGPETNPAAVAPAVADFFLEPSAR
ncbi:alpha/beta hydrolase [Kitasatospora purpeofusca]|uniref:alpha/beta fold hydrolase n=1 Tax=Kitasatospora purpeofusca TaxID=67352 RepID=UPI00224CCB15|nr:alpha/beta hydrolase [Kitasatospora purpeofusca]MCX4683975.1 alpha/beta hydrolase [Kitasatospora purpeofusca]